MWFLSPAIFSHGTSHDSCLLRDTTNKNIHTAVTSYLFAYEDGTDRVFRNVGI
jgi:hypothetical protein